jgi:exonuclease SbcC
MIKRITVRNFMTHKATVLELAEGVTVITGANNTGKSALVEALRSIAHNPAHGKTAIRHGEKCANVQVELNSGEIVEWERTDKSTVYRLHILDGDKISTEIYAKFGRTPPEDVRKLLRLDPVQTEGDPVDIHIGNQRNPIFLLDQVGSQAASFFAASTEAVHLLRMQQALKTRTDRSRTERKTLEKRCIMIEKELERLKALDSIEPEILRAETLYREIHDTWRDLPLLQRLADDLDAIMRLHSLTEKGCSILAPLQTPPRLDEVIEIDKIVKLLERDCARLRFIGGKHDIIAGLCIPPELVEVQALNADTSRIMTTHEEFEKASLKLDVLSLATPPPPLQQLRDLQELMESLHHYQSRERSLLRQAEVLASALLPPICSEVAELHSLTEGITDKEILLQSCERCLHALDFLPSPPQLEEVKELSTVIGSMHAVARAQKIASAREAALQVLPPHPELTDLRHLQTTIGELDTCRRRAAQTESVAIELSSLASPPVLHVLMPLDELVTALATRWEQAEFECTRLEILHRVAVPPELLSTAGLEQTTGTLDSLEDALKEVEALRERLAEALDINRDKIEKALEEAGSCPLCGHLLDLAHFLEDAHA